MDLYKLFLFLSLSPIPLSLPPSSSSLLSSFILSLADAQILGRVLLINESSHFRALRGHFFSPFFDQGL